MVGPPTLRDQISELKQRFSKYKKWKKEVDEVLDKQVLAQFSVSTSLMMEVERLQDNNCHLEVENSLLQVTSTRLVENHLKKCESMLFNFERFLGDVQFYTLLWL